MPPSFKHKHRKNPMSGVSLADLENVTWKIKLLRSWLYGSYVISPFSNSKSEIVTESSTDLDTRFRIPQSMKT